jgi:hypothetical protein
MRLVQRLIKEGALVDTAQSIVAGHVQHGREAEGDKVLQKRRNSPEK